jgi:Sec-independent protein translocase protein TatA
MAGLSAMPFAFLNLGAQEIVILVVVAIVVWGRRLPEVAGQAAGVVQRMRRSLDDLRRETGIDREIQNARRAVDEALPRGVRTLDVRREARRLVEEATRPAPADEPPAPSPPLPAPAPEEPPAPPPAS